MWHLTEHTAASAATGNDAPPPPPLRVFLKVNRKRGRGGFAEDAPASQLVRVQWEETEMGAPPAVLQPAIAAQTRFVFRRLQRAVNRGPAARTGDARAPAQPSRTAVMQVTQARQCVVIECGDASSSDAADTAVELFVLDAHATEAQAMHDAFGEFAITDGASDSWTPSAKRGREADGAGDAGELPVFVLAPVRRYTKAEDHAAAGERGDSTCTTPWGTVAQDDADGTMWSLLREYDELLCVEETGAAAADLYCYPDHRKDDEYDSNAEDFSGNDYPDDADDGSHDASGNADRDGSSCATEMRRRHAHEHASYGMFYEEGYHERNLSSGWSSDDGM